MSKFKVGDKVVVKDNLADKLRELTFYEDTCVDMHDRFAGTTQEIYALWTDDSSGQQYATVDICCEIPVDCLELV